MLSALLVTNAADSGPGSLRAEVALAESGTTFTNVEINFQPGIGNIVLTSGTINLTGNLSIVGPAGGITIARSQSASTPAFPVLSVSTPTTTSITSVVSLANLTITGGYNPLTNTGGVGTPGEGGGICNNAILTVTNSTVTGNSAQAGGGISSFGSSSQLTLIADTISNNLTKGPGGGVRGTNINITSSTISGNTGAAGGGLNLSVGTITNSTIVGNTDAGGFGSGIFSPSVTGVTMTNCTVVGNTGGPGSFGLNGIGVLTNSIISGNSPSELNAPGAVATNNIIGDGSGGLNPTTNLLGVNPKLGPLANNGGPTLTMVPLSGSPAIGAGAVVSGRVTDQRFAFLATSSIDIGAVQTGVASAYGVPVNTTIDSRLPGAGLISLRNALTLSNLLQDNNVITFDTTVFKTPKTITIDPTLGSFTITANVTIQGPSVGLTLAANASTSNLTVISNAPSVQPTIDLQRLTITGGQSLSLAGGIDTPDSVLILENCSITGNSGGRVGGLFTALLTMIDSTVSNNTGRTYGGIGSVSCTIINSTISGNDGGNTGGLIFGSDSIITNSTITNNTSGTTRDRALESTGTGSVLNNSIVAGNVGGDIMGSITGQGNLIGDGSGGFDPLRNLLNVNPLLGPLQNNGGLTATQLPLPGSPVFNAGTISLSPAGITVDQRGQARTLHGNVDIGAVEVGAPVAVTSLTTTAASGAFGTGKVISIVVNFVSPVTVTGTPSLALNSGGTAVYSSGSGTNALTFVYTVKQGDASSKLDTVGNLSLTNSPGGSITGPNNAPLNLVLPAPGSAGSLSATKTIVVDTVAPTVIAYRVLYGKESYNLIGAPPRDLPWTITGIQVVFSKPITTGTAGSLTGLQVNSLTGLGTNTLTWTITPISIGKFGTVLQGSGSNALTDAAGNGLMSGNGFTQNFRVLLGDFDGDGTVTYADVSSETNAETSAYNPFADINGDGVVNIYDVIIVINQLNKHL